MTERSSRFGQKQQNVAPHDRIEQSLNIALSDIALNKFDVLEITFSNSCGRTADRLGITVDPDHFSTSADQSGEQHRHITHSRTDIENALPGSDAGFAKEAFRNWKQTRRLADKPFMLTVGAAQQIL
jgi:hypothetical protein